MQNFDWTSFTKRIAVKSSIAEIYSAWTISAKLETWFLERVIFKVGNDGSSQPIHAAQSGSHYEWYWYLDQTPMRGQILQANGTDFIQFTFEGSSLVDVKLSSLDEYVIIELRHHNIPQDDLSKQHIRLGCSNGWAFYLHNLKSVYEGGFDGRISPIPDQFVLLLGPQYQKVKDFSSQSASQSCNFSTV